MTFPGYDYFSFQTDDSLGVPLYVKHLPWIRSWVGIGAMIHTGARHDPKGKEGLAHCLEHLVFDGSRNFPSQQRIKDLDCELFGDHLDGHTSFEHTYYDGATLTRELPRALDALSDLIFHPLLKPEDLVRERDGVIRQEIRNRIRNAIEADIKRANLSDLLPDHPRGRSVSASGWEETVATIEPCDLAAFHERHYTRANMSLFFAGDIRMRAAKRLARRFLEHVPDGIAPERHPVRADWPAPTIQRREYSYRDLYTTDKEFTRQSNIEMERIVPKRYPLPLLSTISHLLRNILIEKLRSQLGGVYDLHVGIEDYSDLHWFHVDMKVEHGLWERAIECVQETLANFRTGSEYADFFEKSRLVRLKQLITYNPSVDEIIEGAIDDVSVYGRVIPLAEAYRERLAITYDEARTLMCNEFTDRQLHWTIMHP